VLCDRQYGTPPALPALARAGTPNYVEFHVVLNPNCSDQPIQISIDEP